jgi:resuscitation-promoting factor RpfB
MSSLQSKSNKISFRIFLILFLFIVSISACNSQVQSSNKISVIILVDNQQLPVEVEKGASVQAALDQAKVTLGNLDKAEPASYTIVNSNLEVKVTRVREEFEVEEITIPFSRQTMKNESLPSGQTMLIQPGVNGVQQITYRRLLENGIQTSRTIFKTNLLKDSKPEIVMVGVQTPFTAISIPGRLAFLTAGNAWVMEKTTGGRRPVVSSGDLDGHIFTLSPDGNWLLYTRKPTKDDDANTTLNTLWMVKVSDNNPEPVYLRVKNIIHFAAWVPGQGLTIGFNSPFSVSIIPTESGLE